MRAIDKAREAGIVIPAGRSDFRSPCPSCSAMRRKKRDPCLHVTVDAGLVRWCCFHCGYQGAAFDDREPLRRASGGRRPARRWW